LAFFSIEEDANLDVFVRLKYMLIMSSFHKLSKQLILRIEKDRPIQWVYSLEKETPTLAEENREEEDDGFEKDPEARLVFYLVQCEEP
jgi:hypothetical protein